MICRGSIPRLRRVSKGRVLSRREKQWPRAKSREVCGCTKSKVTPPAKLGTAFSSLRRSARMPEKEERYIGCTCGRPFVPAPLLRVTLTRRFQILCAILFAAALQWGRRRHIWIAAVDRLGAAGLRGPRSPHRMTGPAAMPAGLFSFLRGALRGELPIGHCGGGGKRVSWRQIAASRAPAAPIPAAIGPKPRLLICVMAPENMHS